MLDIYAQAWVVDEEMANLIRDAWYRGEIDDDQAVTARMNLIDTIARFR